MSVVGSVIAKVRAMTDEELAVEGWEMNRHGRPTVLEFGDGSKIYASQDPEGNGPGALFGVTSEVQNIYIGHDEPSETN